MAEAEHRIMADAYIADGERAKHVFTARNPEQIILDYTSGVETPGFAPVEHGARILLDFMLGNMLNRTLSVFVTHDALIMPFIKHFVGTRFTYDNWLPFLGGCVIYSEGGRIYIDNIETKDS